MPDEYRGVHAAYYDATSGHYQDDIAFYVEEAKQSGSPVLELGCGTGRILIPVARAGVDIIGLDQSPDMLEVARQKVASLDADTRGRIGLVEGDMSDFDLGRQFNLVMIPFRAFLHLITPEDQRRALTCIREHLTEGGRLIFSIFDPRLDLIAAHGGPLGAAIKKQNEFAHPDTGHKVVVWESRHYDLERQVIEEVRIFEELDGEGRVISKTYSPMTLRFAYRYEMQYLLELCGYQIEALYGDFQRAPFRYGGEQVWVARKG